MVNYTVKMPSEDKQQENLDKWIQANPNCWKLLEKNYRLPWAHAFLNSLVNQIKAKGKLSDKQKSAVTSIYADNCIISDRELARQLEARKMLARIMLYYDSQSDKPKGEQISYKTIPFIRSVYWETTANKRGLTINQLRAVEKIYKYNEHLVKDIDVPDTWGCYKENA